MSTVTSYDTEGNGTVVSGAALLTPALSDREATALLTSGKVTPEEFCAWLKGKTTAKGWHPSNPRLKVTPKGCVHFGGCHNRQFGLTLYVSTLEYLFSVREQVEEFIRDHNGQLARK